MIETKTEQREAKGKTLALGLAVAFMATCVLLAEPAHAATFTVNSTGDDRDQALADGSCFTGNVPANRGRMHTQGGYRGSK